MVEMKRRIEISIIGKDDIKLMEVNICYITANKP